MNLPFLGRTIDERFLNRRLKSTSTAGIITGLLAILLFAWRFYVNHIWSWDILAIALTFVGVKMAMMAWYFITD
jgi:glycopeptide antibiotics resistance protein